ncbi:GTP-binding protein Rhes-like [Paramormyrops kingsleyae]|uniref:GTP-binding protein Rhes-like n=1 Tax=Paramormyrops kingsleyae TaxID=1676925 RepID=UPI003B96BF85
MRVSGASMDAKSSGVFFPVHGTAEVNGTGVDRPESGVPVEPQRCALGGPQTQFPGVRNACSGDPSKVLLKYRNASDLRVSYIPKSEAGIIKSVTAHWLQPETKARTVRSSSIGSRYPSLDRFPCKRFSVDRLAALALHGQTCHLNSDTEPRSVKPKNRRRIVVLGARKVGKTSILRRFLRDGFEEHYEPTSEDFHRKLYDIRGETYQIDILDASGERDFPAKRRLSILTGDIFLLVFSVDDKESLDEVCALLKEVVAAKCKLLKSKENACIPAVICGNKVDLSREERTVSHADVFRALGDDFPYFEISAKEGTNLEEMFEVLAERGGLPTETGPSQHRKISIRSYRALRSGRPAGRRITPVQDAPCGALCPLTRRPSFNTDLRQVLGTSTSRKRRKPLDKCQIQ